jgi:L-cysteine S-thiosulfotransferase
MIFRVFVTALLFVSSVAAQPDARRSGASYMSPTLQALQRDDTQNPGQLWVREGEALWSKKEANDRSCAGCHALSPMRTASARYPALNAQLKLPQSLADRINQCRVEHLGKKHEDADGAEVLALNAWLAHLARGVSVAPASDPGLDAARKRGEALWALRMGQLNLSCAQCHDQRAGERLGGAAIPQAHPTGYPTYRLEWQTLGSLYRRMRGCLVGVRAEPFPVAAVEWRELELYLMQRASGMPLEGVAVRP